MIYYLTGFLIAGIALHSYLKYKRKNYRCEIEFNLDDKPKLCFERGEYGMYVVYFYNPILGKWLQIPKYQAYLEYRFDFGSKWSIDFPEMNAYYCQYKNIESMKDSFKTFADINSCFEEMNKERDKYFKEENKKKSYPKQVYTK